MLQTNEQLKFYLLCGGVHILIGFRMLFLNKLMMHSFKLGLWGNFNLMGISTGITLHTDYLED
jgi:hypothetical protein